jgi:hypothetical protein
LPEDAAVYIVAIAWLYVLMLVSVMQPTVFRGIVTFVGAGLLPLALLLYLVGTPQRRRQRQRASAQETVADAQSNHATGAEAGARPGPEGGPPLDGGPLPDAAAPAVAPVSADRSR